MTSNPIGVLLLRPPRALIRCRRTVCVTRKWAGVDKDEKREKLEARKMLLNRADSHLSGARFVGRFWIAQDSLLEKRHYYQHHQTRFYKQSVFLMITKNTTCPKLLWSAKSYIFLLAISE